MQVVFVTTTFNKKVCSGPELYAQNIWDLFNCGQELKLHVVCLDSDLKHERISAVGVKAKLFGLPYQAVEAKLNEVLDKFNEPPIVHVNSSHILSPRCVRRTNAMIQINDTEVCNWRPFRSAINYGLRRMIAVGWRRQRESKAVRLASKVICNSKSTAKAIKQAYRLEDAEVIYKAVELEPFWEVAKKRRLALHDCVKLIFVGSNWKLKGLDVLLEALKILDGKSPGRYRLDICGGDTIANRNWLSHQLMAKSLEQSVKMVGHIERSELPLKLVESDLLVMPSRSEALGTGGRRGASVGNACSCIRCRRASRK